MNENKDIKDYPAVLRVEHICEVLDISKPIAYDLMEATGFPILRIGKKKYVTRENFFSWLNDTREVA